MDKKLSKQILEQYKIDINLISRFIDKFGKSTISLNEDIFKTVPNFDFSAYAEKLLDNSSLLEYLSFMEAVRFFYDTYKFDCLKTYNESKLENDEFVCFKFYMNNINNAWLQTVKQMNLKFFELYNG